METQWARSINYINNQASDVKLEKTNIPYEPAKIEMCVKSISYEL